MSDERNRHYKNILMMQADHAGIVL